MQKTGAQSKNSKTSSENKQESKKDQGWDNSPNLVVQSLEDLLNKYSTLDSEFVKDIFNSHNRDAVMAEIAIYEIFPQVLDTQSQTNQQTTAHTIENVAPSKKTKRNTKKPIAERVYQVSQENSQPSLPIFDQKTKSKSSTTSESDDVVYITQPPAQEEWPEDEYSSGKGLSQLRTPNRPSLYEEEEATLRLIEAFKKEEEVTGRDITKKDLQKICRVIQEGWKGGEVTEAEFSKIQSSDDIILLQAHIAERLGRHLKKLPPPPDEIKGVSHEFGIEEFPPIVARLSHSMLWTQKETSSAMLSESLMKARSI